MNRIKVSENAEFTLAFPRAMMNRIEIVTRSGQRHVEEGRYPKGHLENPMTDAEVDQKFRALCHGPLGKSRSELLLAALWTLEQQAGLGDVLDLVRIDDK